MKKSKVFLIATMLITSLVLGACGTGKATPAPSDASKANEETTDTKDGAKTEGPVAETKESDQAPLKIAIVSSPSGVDDGSFNQNNYEGILDFIAMYPDATVKAIQEPTGDPAASTKAVADIIADYDVVVVPGFQFSGISTIAKENPTKKFILIDSTPDKVGDQEEFENIYAMTFAEEESGFFAGVAAAFETKTNKVAVVGGAAYPPVVNYQFGFMSGVNYANKVYGTNAEIVELAPYAGTDVTGTVIGGNYVGSFNDEPVGKVVGNALIKEGVDIIFVAAGNSGNGVFTAAKEATNVKIIGCDVDQFNDGVNGSSNIILTSALKVMDLNVMRTLEQIQDGTFKGGNAVLKADTDSTGIVKTEGRHQMAVNTINKLNEVFELVKIGEIVPASNFNGLTPDTFTGMPQ